MVVIPRVLEDLLKQTSPHEQKLLALNFAEHALQMCKDVVDGAAYEATADYLRVAREGLSGELSIDRLAQARRKYFGQRTEASGLSGEVTWVAAIAVAASWQRELESADVVAFNSYIPTVANVAREAQAVVGRSSASSATGGEGPQAAQTAQRARWEEARWQLIQLIEVLPNPSS